jgi:hypothetical protein
LQICKFATHAAGVVNTGGKFDNNTFCCEYLCEFLEKIETALFGALKLGGNSIHEKT